METITLTDKQKAYFRKYLKKDIEVVNLENRINLKLNEIGIEKYKSDIIWNLEFFLKDTWRNAVTLKSTKVLSNKNETRNLRLFYLNYTGLDNHGCECAKTYLKFLTILKEIYIILEASIKTSSEIELTEI
jgi:hypothetical protein